MYVRAKNVNTPKLISSQLSMERLICDHTLADIFTDNNLPLIGFTDGIGVSYYRVLLHLWTPATMMKKSDAFAPTNLALYIQVLK